MADQNRSLLQNRARNLFVIASGISVFLLAGADIEQLAFGAIKTPARYPEVVRAAAVVLLLWFWWRYTISWLDSREKYDIDYLRALHSSGRFQEWLLKQLQKNHSDFLHERFLDTNPEGEVSGEVTDIREDSPSRFSYKVSTITFKQTPDTGIVIKAGPNAPEIKIPFFFHFRMSTGFRLWRALRREDFADTMLPHIIASVAAALIIFAWLGFDPAGFFGWLDGYR